MSDKVTFWLGETRLNFERLGDHLSASVKQGRRHILFDINQDQLADIAEYLKQVHARIFVDWLYPKTEAKLKGEADE